MGIGFFCVVVIPIVWMMLHHQRKMAELLHRGFQTEDQSERVSALEAEVRQLKAQVTQMQLPGQRQEPELPERLRREV